MSEIPETVTLEVTLPMLEVIHQGIAFVSISKEPAAVMTHAYLHEILDALIEEHGQEALAAVGAEQYRQIKVLANLNTAGEEVKKVL